MADYFGMEQARAPAVPGLLLDLTSVLCISSTLERMKQLSQQFLVLFILAGWPDCFGVVAAELQTV